MMDVKQHVVRFIAGGGWEFGVLYGVLVQSVSLTLRRPHMLTYDHQIEFILLEFQNCHT
jgi:hypothetical protein